MTIAWIICLMLSGASSAPQDPNAPDAPRRPVGFRVFNNMDQPVTGLWELEIPDERSRRLEIRESVPGNPNALVALDAESGEEILRLARKKVGIGFEGQMSRLLSACGYDALPISEFLPLGDAAVLRFEMSPPSAPCAPLDGGRAARFFALSTRGGPVKLRALSEISNASVRETYSIGGDRPNEVDPGASPGGIAVEDGSELRFLRRVKAPLDGTYWFEVEALVSPAAGVEAPRGFLKADMIRVVGSLTLKRVR